MPSLTIVRFPVVVALQERPTVDAIWATAMATALLRRCDMLSRPTLLQLQLQLRLRLRLQPLQWQWWRSL